MSTKQQTNGTTLIVTVTPLTIPFGTAYLYGTPTGLLAIALPGESAAPIEAWLRRMLGPLDFVTASEAQQRAAIQLTEYFAGTRRSFDLVIDWHGTPFQRAAWAAVADVPYGETRTYGEIALLLGRPNAARAVGAANGANPLAPVVPCHRLIGADGSLRGYRPGLAMKRWLLDFERRA